MEKVAELRKSAEKMSQLIRRPSQESITSDSSPIPPFKPIPKITLQRSSSLPRIEVERPSTPAPAPAGLVTSKPQQHDYSLGQNIPPNAKKLRVRSFLWVKPSVAGLDTSIYSQLVPVLVVNIAALSSGLAIGCSSILLPQLRPGPPGSHRPFTAGEQEGGWIAAMFSLGAIAGGLLSAVLGARFGRRVSILALAVPDLLGWILVAAAQNLPMMLAGRFLSGLAAAGYSPNIQIFVAEITEARHRGWLSGLTLPMMSIGVLLMYTLGSWLPWHWAAASCTAVPVILAASLYTYHDSPYWYFSIGKEKAAHAALEQFRGPGANIVSEVFTIQQHLNETEEDITFGQAVLKLVTEKKYFQPFIILNFLFFLMIFSGKYTIDFYAVDFFKMTGSHVDEYVSAVIVAFVHLVGSLLFIALVKKTSRKLLLCVSALTMGVSLLILGVSMFYSTYKDWVPLVCTLLYMLAAPLGLTSIPFLYMAEFYPSELRSVLAGLTTMLTNIMMAVLLKTFSSLDSLLGHHGVSWLYAAACFGSIIFSLSYVPETKDKHLTVISDKFARLCKPERASPWVSPTHSPSMNSVRKFQYRSQMFTQ